MVRQVILTQVSLGALRPGEEGGLTRYLHATGGDPGSAIDAGYFKQSISKWSQLVPKAVASASVLSKHLCTLQVMYVCIHTHTRTHVLSKHLCTLQIMYVCIHTHTHTHVLSKHLCTLQVMYVYTHTHTPTHTYTHIHTRPVSAPVYAPGKGSGFVL